MYVCVCVDLCVLRVLLCFICVLMRAVCVVCVHALARRSLGRGSTAKAGAPLAQTTARSPERTRRHRARRELRRHGRLLGALLDDVVAAADAKRLLLFVSVVRME